MTWGFERASLSGVLCIIYFLSSENCSRKEYGFHEECRFRKTTSEIQKTMSSWINDLLVRTLSPYFQDLVMRKTNEVIWGLQGHKWKETGDEHSIGKRSLKFPSFFFHPLFLHSHMQWFPPKPMPIWSSILQSHVGTEATIHTLSHFNHWVIFLSSGHVVPSHHALLFLTGWFHVKPFIVLPKPEHPP